MDYALSHANSDVGRDAGILDALSATQEMESPVGVGFKLNPGIGAQVKGALVPILIRNPLTVG